MKVDVAVQSYKKPESLVYTLLSLKKYCGKHIDTIYINDDCSGEGVVEHYTNPDFLELMKPIKIKVRINTKPSGYTHTIVTKEVLLRKNIIQQFQLLGHFLIKRAKWYSTTDDIRYQWAINNTDKKYIFLIHDDIKFFDDVLGLYIKRVENNDNLAIVGDLGGSKRCIFGPCGEKCGPELINKGVYPCVTYPNMGAKSFIYKMLGRYRRYCRINEWCALLSVDVARQLEGEGTYFGNYESGGDVGTYWFDKVIKQGYSVYDPLPSKDERLHFYFHCWQGHPGHSVWVKQECDTKKYAYDGDFIKRCIQEEFGYDMR